MKDRREWLATLKAGDEVHVSESMTKDDSIRKVDRTTKTQIVIGNSKFRRSNGFPVGSDTWIRRHIEKPTAESRKRIKRARMVRLLNSVKWSEVSDAALSAIVKIAMEERRDRQKEEEEREAEEA
jgi:hypothetical protein